MNENIGHESGHPAGEPETALVPVASEEEELVIDTPGGRYRASFDEHTPVSPLGPLVFFAQFLQASGRFEALCQDAPLAYGSPNAYPAREVIGTLVLGILAGHWRYAHLSALRFDAVAPGLLGLGGLVSEDSVRRGLRRIDQLTGRQWLTGHLRQSWWEFLSTPWILDVDTTIKPIYGRQEGARVGYNPQKPGRPSHALHTYWISTLRLCLDVEVHPGNAHAASYGLDGLWTLIDQLPKERRPHVVRGDCSYGQEACLLGAETRGQGYLFKVRRTKGARAVIKLVECTRESRWQDAGQGWQGVDATLQLTGWSRERRVVVLRRRLREARSPRARRHWAKQQLSLLLHAGVEISSCEVVDYEYQILITNLPYGLETLAPMYRARGDAENPFDELKNQWGWGGFTTHALASGQHTARLIALVYNWWTLYNRLVEPGQHHEAITSRPRLLGGVAKQSEHAGQRRLAVRLLHADAPDLKPRIVAVVHWLQHLLTNAEQLDVPARWRRIVDRILKQNFGIKGPAPPALPAPP
jgi:hypothetical protein